VKSVHLRGMAIVGAAALAISLAAAAPSNANTVPLALPAAATDPAVVGQWSAPFDMGGIAIHATLTHTGDVLFFSYVEGAAGVDHTSYIATWNYRTGVTTEAPFTYNRDVFCASQNVLPNGDVFIAGGHDATTGKKQDAIGVAETDIYDPVTRSWSVGPLMSQKRWYPTNIGLPNGKTLIFGGMAKVGQPSNIVEMYNPGTNTMTQLPASASRPLGTYPRMHLLPNGRLLVTGPPRMSASFNPAGNTWSNVSRMLYGARQRGNSVLLPGADQVLAVGGHWTNTAPPTGTAEILDTSAATPKWRFTGSLNYPRLDANTVVLPDGQVLIVGGGAQQKYVNPVKIPEIYNPTTEMWTALAPQQASRMYHSTALLLPDGRVLSAGQDNGPLATFGEVFSPPYLFRGPRPSVSSAPTATGYGQQLRITSPDAADIASVTLIKAGSVTHEIDTDQRSVPLNFTATGDIITAQSPANANVAPPGYYMLFIVNSNGVPSIAPWVQVG
jgi:galactose oxidase